MDCKFCMTLWCRGRSCLFPQSLTDARPRLLTLSFWEQELCADELCLVAIVVCCPVWSCPYDQQFDSTTHEQRTAVQSYHTTVLSASEFQICNDAGLWRRLRWTYPPCSDGFLAKPPVPQREGTTQRLCWQVWKPQDTSCYYLKVVLAGMTAITWRTVWFKNVAQNQHMTQSAMLWQCWPVHKPVLNAIYNLNLVSTSDHSACVEHRVARACGRQFVLLGVQDIQGRHCAFQANCIWTAQCAQA